MIKVKKNIEHVIAFGCSYTFGEELPEALLVQSEFFNKNKHAVSLYNRRKTKNFRATLTPEDRNFWYTLLKKDYNDPDSCYDHGFESYRNLANQMSYAGRLSNLLNAKTYQNFSISGSSNHLIIMSLIMNKHVITEDSLVIIGLTHPLRKTKMFENYNYKFCGPHRHYNVFVDTKVKDDIASEFSLSAMLPIDNDSIIQELHLVYQIIKILEKLNCSYIIYDTTWMLGIELLDDLSLNTYKNIPSLLDKCNDSWCFLGHPGNDAHESVAKIMFKLMSESL
jgi:hypothetical protein